MRWWEDEEESVYPQRLRSAAGDLAAHLLRRVAVLTADDLDIEVVLQEIKRQTAEAAVDGNLVRASDFAYLAVDLISAKEAAKRLL